MQRFADPLLVTLLFGWVQSFSAPHQASAGYHVELIVLLLTALVLPSGKLYQSYRQASLWTLARRISASWALVLMGLLVLAFATKDTANFSRFNLSLWALLCWALLLLGHVGGRKLLRWYRIQGGNSRTVLYWGTPRQALAFYGQLQKASYIGLQLQAWFQPPGSEPLTLPEGMPPCSGGLREMLRWLSEHDVDQIYFSYISEQDMTMQDMVRIFGDTCKPVFYLPVWAQPSMRFQVEKLGGSHAIALWGVEDSQIDRQIKRAADLFLGIVALLLLSPVLVVVAALVGLSSPGPIFFLQDRYGLDGRRFKVFKFRTMSVMEDGASPGLQQARCHDPRVTPVGRILRRWSLDELPQLFNVIHGSMSLVGPRPHAVDHNEQYRKLIPGYMQRHLSKPGMTGLAQVEGWRGETADLQAMANRIDADLRYQREWSLGLDIKILIKTLLHLRSPHAY